MLAKQFSKISYIATCSDKFRNEQMHEITFQLNRINLTHFSESQFNPEINSFFSMSELETVQSELKSSAPGADNIFNCMISNLPRENLTVLLLCFNRICMTNAFPDVWLHSIAIPVHKSNKPFNEPASFHTYPYRLPAVSVK